MGSRELVALVLALLACGAGLGCTGEDTARCQGDAACGSGARCVQGACRCVSDEACPAGLRCNAAGFCQEPSPCRSNRDCAPTERCDGRVGRCGIADACPRDLHCALSEVCVDSVCVEGCRADSDCPLGQLCDGPGPGLGRCEAGCRSTSGCPLGGLCVGGRCFFDTYPELCDPCGGPRDCGGADRWCLENRGHVPGEPSTGPPRQCAVDCAADPEICPNGYACRPVVAPTAAPCRVDLDCGAGRSCLVDEGEPVGRCTCGRDGDCTGILAPRCALGLCEAPAGRTCGSALDCDPVEACGPYGPGRARVCYLDRGVACERGADCLCLGGVCTLTGRACRTAADCPVRCEAGGCVVGAGCTPEEGLSCPDLR